MHYQFVPSTAFTVFCIFSVLTGKVTGLPHLPFEVETAENSPIHEETFLKSQTLTVGPLEMVRNPVIFIEDLTGTYHELTQGRKPAENFPAHQERVQESAAVKQKPSSPTVKPLQMVGKPVIFMQDHTGLYHEVTQGNRSAENLHAHHETVQESAAGKQKPSLPTGKPLQMVGKPVIFMQDHTGTYHELTPGRKTAENLPAHQETVQESAAGKQKPSSPTGKPLQMVGKPVIFMQDHTGTYHEVTQGNRTVENLPAHKETVHESPSENEKSSFLGEDSFGMVGKPVIFIEDLTGTYHELTQGNKEGIYRNNSKG